MSTIRQPDPFELTGKLGPAKVKCQTYYRIIPYIVYQMRSDTIVDSIPY